MIDQLSTFSFPTWITFGAGSIGTLPGALKDNGVAKPLLVTDPGLKATEVFTAVEKVLNEAGVSHEVFSGVHGNPLEEDVAQAVEQFQSAGCDGSIGLGGGSALDVAKVIPAAAGYDGPLADLEVQSGGVDRIQGPLAPIITIPTTAGTGSEVGRASVITIPELGRKIIILSPQMMPKRAILDPELTVSLPPHLTAATGMDAFTHCLESLTAPIFHPLCDAIAIHGLELIIQNLERAVKDGHDIEARGTMLIAASMGAIAFQKDLGAAHSLAHPLSTEFGMHHGLANAIVLPAVMRFNKEICRKQYARLAGLFGVNTFEISEETAANQAIECVADLNRRIGIPARLRERDVPEDGLEKLSRKAFEDPCHQTNARPCTREDLLELYKNCW